MPSDSSKHRRSIRLQEYDYTQAGAYFLTICADERKSMFGTIVDGEIKLNQVGEAVKDEWLKTSAIRKNVELDEYVIMPNHFHAILWILEGRGTARRAPTVTLCHLILQNIAALFACQNLITRKQALIF